MLFLAGALCRAWLKAFRLPPSMLCLMGVCFNHWPALFWNRAKKLLIRAVGPTLGGAPFNFPGTLSDPLLRVTRADDGVVIRENDNWEQGNDTSLLNSAAVSVGAFPLNGGSKDAAVLMNLPPGRYNAQVVAPGSATGVALIEVYEVP